jgi:hypothetical protein
MIEAGNKPLAGRKPKTNGEARRPIWSRNGFQGSRLA